MQWQSGNLRETKKMEEEGQSMRNNLTKIAHVDGKSITLEHIQEAGREGGGV